MGTNECSQSISKSYWDSQDFGYVNMVLKWPIFTSPLGHNELKDERHTADIRKYVIEVKSLFELDRFTVIADDGITKRNTYR